MRWFMLVTAAFTTIVSAAPSEKKIVCYFGSWSVYRPSNGRFDIADIDSNLCTHLIYTFVGLSEDGNIRVLDSWQDLPNDYGKNGFGRLNALREKNPALKTLVAIGGWNQGSTKYSRVFGDPSLRATFVENAVKFVKKYGFNGLDIDWEYPNQRGGKAEDVQSFTLLTKELKEKFTAEGLLLSAAVASVESSASKSYNIREMSKYVDFINVMAYDLRGAWDEEKKLGINAPLYPSLKEDGLKQTWNVDNVVKYWLGQGAPPEKIILGTAFYGRAFTLADSNKHDVGDLFSGPGKAGKYTREPGILGYNEICEMQKTNQWTTVFDDEQQVPYSYSGSQWVGFDDVKSLSLKAQYLMKMGLGGAMLWSIETDDFKGICGEKYPLLKTLNSVLRNGVPVPSPSYPPATEEPSSPNPPTEEPTYATEEPENSSRPPVDPSRICQRIGYVRDPVDCSLFYYCNPIGNSYEISQFQCPAGTAFDTSIVGCNYKNLVNC